MRIRIVYEDVAKLNLPQRAMLEAFAEAVEQSVDAVGEMSMEQAHRVAQVLEQVLGRATVGEVPHFERRKERDHERL